MVSRKTTAERRAVPGEYTVDLSDLGNVPLSDVLGDLSHPLLLTTLQERLWSYFRREKVLEAGTKRRVRTS